MTFENISRTRWSEIILILGKGYIGTQLNRYLLTKGYQVILVDYKTMNYHNVSILNKYILNNSISTIINCSGFTGRPNVDEAQLKKEKCWELNVLSPIKVASLCNKLNVKYIHISSGCIYSGYDKEFEENDVPNFGLFDTSSFYSKSKHAFELHTRDLNYKLLRIRMPICEDLKQPRNFINKIMKYENLIDYKNSKTYIPDLCGFINILLKSSNVWKNKGQDIYNIINPEALTTKELVELLKPLYPDANPNWVNIEDLNITAPRSNCVLNGKKASKLYNFRTETQIIEELTNEN